MPSLVSPNSAQPDYGLPETLASFVETMSTDLTRFPLPSDPLVWEGCMELIQKLSQDYRSKILRYMPLTHQIATQIYNCCSQESQTFVAIFCALGYLVNDQVPDEIVPKLESFPVKFNTGNPHGDSSLDLMEHLLLVQLPRIAGPIATGCIVKATFDYFIGLLMQKRLAETPSKFTNEFPVWLRRKTGLSEAMSFLAFPEARFPESEYLHVYLPIIPSLVQIIDEINDVLSSYKEIVVGNEKNLISNLALANGWSIQTAAENLCNGLISIKDNLNMTLSGNTIITADDVSFFCDGWIAWHLQQSKRYKLDQIGLQL